MPKAMISIKYITNLLMLFLLNFTPIESLNTLPKRGSLEFDFNSSRRSKSDRLVLGKKIYSLPIKRLFSILETCNLMQPNDCREALNYLNKCRENSNSTIKGNGFSINEVIETRAADIQYAQNVFYKNLATRAHCHEEARLLELVKVDYLKGIDHLNLPSIYGMEGMQSKAQEVVQQAAEAVTTRDQIMGSLASTSLDNQELPVKNDIPLKLTTLAIALKFKSAFKSPYAQLPRISSEVFNKITTKASTDLLKVGKSFTMHHKSEIYDDIRSLIPFVSISKAIAEFSNTLAEATSSSSIYNQKGLAKMSSGGWQISLPPGEYDRNYAEEKRTSAPLSNPVSRTSSTSRPSSSSNLKRLSIVTDIKDSRDSSDSPVPKNREREVLSIYHRRCKKAFTEIEDPS
jgi:hypothetical protein